MKIEYHLTPHRVIHSHVHLLGSNSVESVLERALWFPPVLKVHIVTKECCTAPQFALDGTSSLTDPRLARFVAVEGSTFEVICHACQKVTSVESHDTSLLHWRSKTDVRWWKYLPWFSLAMENSIVTGATGQEESWANQHHKSLLNQAPVTVEPLSPESLEECKSRFLLVVNQVRHCVHPRLHPHMQFIHNTGKVYVAFRERREDGYYFRVKQRDQCLAWPREYITDFDGYAVCAAARCARSCSLELFMQSVVQCIMTYDDEYLFVVKWNDQMVDDTSTFVWVHELDRNMSAIHGMRKKYPWIQLALGTTYPWKFYHGTSLEAANKIESAGFSLTAFHTCPGVYYKCNPPAACCCKGMMGPGVYLAAFEKAGANAGRVAGPDKLGVVLECGVSVGECKFVTSYSVEFCHCGCGSMHSDHVGYWYHEQLYDSVLLCGGAGVKREELCVRRPKRAKVRKVYDVKYNSRRERVFCSIRK